MPWPAAALERAVEAYDAGDLVASAVAVHRAYGIGDAESEALLRWWTALAHPVIATLGGDAPAGCSSLIGLLAACGDDGGDRPEGLSAEGQRGAELADDKGCSACHRSGAVGPRWEGLFGSTVELDDGSTVVADEAYLTLAITDPGAQTVAGFDVHDAGQRPRATTRSPPSSPTSASSVRARRQRVLADDEALGCRSSPSCAPW